MSTPKTIYNFVKMAINTMVYVNCRQNDRFFHVFEQHRRDRKSSRPDLLANPCGGVSILLSARKLFHHLSCSSRAWLCDVAPTQKHNYSQKRPKTQRFYKDLLGQVKKMQCFSILLTSPRKPSGIQPQIHEVLHQGPRGTKKQCYF